MDQEIGAVVPHVLGETSRNQTAKRAAEVLVRSDAGFVVPTAKQKRILLVEFAKRNLVLYGKAFDIVKLEAPIDLNNDSEVGRNLDKIRICEIKSSGKKLPMDLKGYFFALTAAELLVAQNLKDRFKFIFVNTAAGTFVELSLQELLGKARGIYPTWSIMF